MAGSDQALMRLLRWLGPWTPDHRSPDGIQKRREVIRAGRLPGVRGFHARELARPAAWRGDAEPTQLEIVRYYPRESIIGHFIVVQGLHYQGPDDPRLDRFCRVLAGAGLMVHAPMLPGYLDLLLSPTVSDDLELVTKHVCNSLPRGIKPSLFSISFGSAPALEVAARMPEAIDAVVTFGGYAELNTALRFCLDGVMELEGRSHKLSRDPLNAPALFLNLLPFLELREDTQALERALRESVYRTWGRPELKPLSARARLLYDLAEHVPRGQQDLFRLAVGLRDELDGQSAREWLDWGLRQGHEELEFARPQRAIARASRPTVVLHGREDDVIPWGEAVKLERALKGRVPTRLFLTGLFAHTNAEMPSIAELGQELRALLGMATALSRAGQIEAWLQQHPN
ncbi:MAG: hypothetical protein H6718_29000 [Polyangiaceae bacterium]|nr:hypothetical protein [Myxococcales bacterium]MCB9589487.1 hypothetical protein [Polyangiaceae bacterium]MCB9609946.1 hypothetical protein [Polyangiaceae bacterium]